MTKTIQDMTNEEMEEFITKYLPVKNIEKAKYGEVFTPSALIKKMLDKLPPSSWTNPDFKWIDPCCGSGNFLIHVYQRLMTGLKKWQPNEAKRSIHIIENMLYMVELNPVNCNICRKLFGPKANIECSDFLLVKEHIKYNFIIGNPPFQEDNTTGGSGGKSKLYERIFIKSLNLLEDKGYLTFLVPDNMLSGNGNVGYNTLIKHNVQFVSFNSEIQSFFPGIQQYICYFVLQNRLPKNTIIENTDGRTFTTQLLDRPINPVCNWSPYVEKLIKKYITNKKNNAIYNRGKSLELYNGTKYSVIYTSSKKLHTNKLELAPGINIKKAVIFAISPKLEFEIDYTGKYGVGPNTFYIPFDTIIKGRRLNAFLKSEHYITMALACKTSRQFLKIGFIEHLDLNKIMDTDVSSHSKKHIKQIIKQSKIQSKKRNKLTNNKTKKKTNN
jgi:hypothetical protein